MEIINPEGKAVGTVKASSAQVAICKFFNTSKDLPNADILGCGAIQARDPEFKQIGDWVVKMEDRSEVITVASRNE